MLSRLMDLSEAQEGVMNIAFRIADEEKLPLLDLKDLQSLLRHIDEKRDEVESHYGKVSPASLASVSMRSSGVPFVAVASVTPVTP